MDGKDGFVITSRDRILRAWQNSTELVRDYQQYAHEFERDEEKLSHMFAEFAQNEAQRAARLLLLLQGFEKEHKR